MIHSFENAHPLGAHHVAVDLDNGGNTAASSGFGQELIVWDFNEGKEKVRLKSGGMASSFAQLIPRVEWFEYRGRYSER